MEYADSMFEVWGEGWNRQYAQCMEKQIWRYGIIVKMLLNSLYPALKLGLLFQTTIHWI